VGLQSVFLISEICKDKQGDAYDNCVEEMNNITYYEIAKEPWKYRDILEALGLSDENISSMYDVMATDFQDSVDPEAEEYLYGGDLAKHTDDPFEKRWRIQFPTQDFSGNESRISQKNFLHSVPVAYHGAYTSDPILLLDEPTIETNSDKLKDREYYTYKTLMDYGKSYFKKNRVQRILQDKLFANPSQFENKHEYLVGNGLNARAGNFVFQTYVKIEDQTKAGRDALNLRYLDYEPYEICDDESQGNVVNAGDILGADPILRNHRRADVIVSNPFQSHIYGVVPLEVFSWFINYKFFPWINQPDNFKIRLLYERFGFEPFFKSVKMGLRMTYVSNFGTVVQSRALNMSGPATPGHLEWKATETIGTIMGKRGLNNSKAGLSQRTIVLADHKYNKDDSVVDTGGPFINVRGDELSRSYDEDTVDVGEQRKGSWWPQLFNELHIPIVEIEREVEYVDGQIKVGNSYYDFNEFSYDKPVVEDLDGKSIDIINAKHGLGMFDIEAEKMNMNEMVNEFAYVSEDVVGPEAMYRSIVQNPGGFYYKHLAKGMLAELQDSPEFKLVFDHLIPVKRYMALGFLYSSDCILELIGDPTKLLEETKLLILGLLEGLINGADDYTFIPSAVKNHLRDDLLAGVQSTSPNSADKSLTKQIIEIIYKAMLLVLKGFVELTDPAIAIAKFYIDLAKAVYQVVIVTIETTYNAYAMGLQGAIDAANSTAAKVEMTIAMMKPAIEGMQTGFAQKAGPKLVDPEGGDGSTIPGTDLNEDGNITMELKGDIKDWKVEYRPLPDDPEAPDGVKDETFKPAPDSAGDNDPKWTTTWGEFTETADGLMEMVGQYAGLLAQIQELQDEKDAADLKFKAPCPRPGDPTGVSDEEFDKKGGQLACTKKVMENIFGSNFLLPSAWAMLVPSMTPYWGGIVPPPFYVGPPSTIPGMIYLVLLMSDAYDVLKDEEAEGVAKSWQEKCAEEL